MGIKLSALNVELTRKCNKRCAHCVKGEAQNLSMSKEIIDKLFDNIDDCKTIYFGGGEVLLEIDLVEYFVNKIIEHNWNTDDIQLTTNSSICDSRIVDIYDKYVRSRENRFALLRFSDDVFHDKGEFESAFHYYKPLIDEKNRQYDSNKNYIACWFASEGRENSDLPYIIYAGRGKDWVENNRDAFAPYGMKLVKYPYLHNHRIKIENGTVCCTLRLCANGNVVFDEDGSYEIDDEISMGNILEDSFADILLKHNNKCLLRCEEASKITYGERYREFIPNMSENGKMSLNIISMVYKKILKTRELARELYPYLSAQDIIEYIPTPTDFETSRLVEKIYDKYYKELSPKEFISKVDDTIMKKFVSDYKELSKQEMDYRLKLIGAKILLEGEDVYVLPHNSFGTKNDVLSCNTFNFLSTLNDKYKKGLLSPTNDKVFFCTGI